MERLHSSYFYPPTSLLFIQSRVLKGRLNFSRLNIIQTQNDASISRASCALSFIYEAFPFSPPLPFLIQQSIWKWCLSVCVYTHVRACVHIFTRSFVCRSSRLNGGSFLAALAAELLPSCINKLVPSPQQRWPCFSGMNLLPGASAARPFNC